jgi:nitroreductase
VRGELGINDDERIVGFVYIGTPQLDIPPRPLPDVTEYLSNWE